MPTNILLAGVGGQGIITASNVLAHAALISDCDVKKSEVHGMSQRGGSVESHLRFSADSKIHSPLIADGDVDILLAFEPLEALRALPATGTEAVLVVDDRAIVPTSVTCGEFDYPQDVVQRVRESRERVHVVPGFNIGCELGEPRAANVVLLGAVSTFMPFEASAWEKAIRQVLKAKAVDINIEAFQAGMDAVDAE